jgi:hypothetical protein
MRPACHEHTWPGVANRAVCRGETKAVGPALIPSNDAMETTPLSAGPDFFPADAANQRIPTENSIGRS